MNPSTLTLNRRTRAMRNSTMSLLEKRYLHHCSFRSKKNQRTWDKLITLMKKVCYQLSPFSHEQVRWNPYTNQVQICHKKLKSSRDSENERIRILLERQKKQILAEVRSEIHKHEHQAESDKRSIQELTGIIDSQRMEIDQTRTGCEQSRRDQSLLQEEMSKQNRALRETRIRNMREMKEIAEKSRLNGRGTFKEKIDWRLWGSNCILPGLKCQDSLQPWRQRREVPRCWDWRRAHQEFAGFTNVPSGARSKCEPVAGLSLTKRKLVSRCTVNLSKYGETRQLDVTKSANLTKS